MSPLLTNFPDAIVETDISDKTDALDNNTFLRAIFGDSLSNIYPIIVSFAGNPNTIQQKAWYGHPWTGDSSLSAENNNYFSLAVFKENDSGQYRRKKSQFHKLYAVMLDDVGTKVNLEKLTLAPSWLLETSPGNYQAGYILLEPINNSKVADRLMNAIMTAGLCDPGANGPTTRLARLPVAINSKHKPAFCCQLKTWQPEKRYSVQELVKGLQLELIETKGK